MRNLLIQVLAVGLCMLSISMLVAAQQKVTKAAGTGSGVATSVVKTTAKVPVIIVGTAAKAGWEITKFAAVRVAKPAAKTLIVRGAPRAAVYVLKSTGLTAKYLLPFAIKLSLL